MPDGLTGTLAWLRPRARSAQSTPARSVCWWIHSGMSDLEATETTRRSGAETRRAHDRSVWPCASEIAPADDERKWRVRARGHAARHADVPPGDAAEDLTDADSAVIERLPFIGKDDPLRLQQHVLLPEKDFVDFSGRRRRSLKVAATTRSDRRCKTHATSANSAHAADWKQSPGNVAFRTGETGGFREVATNAPADGSRE